MQMDSVRSLAVGDNNIYAGGFFTSIGGQFRNYVAKLNATNGDADLEWNPNANYVVQSIKIKENNVYVGGGFTSIGGQLRNRIAKLNNTNGNADEFWNPNSDHYINFNH